MIHADDVEVKLYKPVFFLCEQRRLFVGIVQLHLVEDDVST